MRWILKYMVLTFLGITLAGCGTAMQEVKAKSQSERTDVFSEVKEEGMPPKGFADLVIRASIKTRLESYYILESKESLHGKPVYPFAINIDGQAAVWKVEGQKNIIPAYDQDGKTSLDPEAGDGMKYVLERRIRLSAGSHKVFFGLPEENYSKNFDIALKEGAVYVLEFKPTYKYKTRPHRIPTFMKGIKGYEVFLDGKQLQ
ncbi:MAG: hypothetical protein ACOYU2_13515 [Nitrospirota bacterium]